MFCNFTLQIYSVGALILAGGKNSRMGGTPKGNLLFQETTFFQRQGDAFRGFPEQLLSTNTPEIAWGSGFQAVPDAFPGQGPMEGIASALEVCKSSALVVVACDMPFITKTFITSLTDWSTSTFSHHPDVLAVAVTDSTGRLHPLCGVYRKASLPLIRHTLAAGERRARNLFKLLNGSEIPLDDLGVSDETIANINTPLEFQKLQVTPPL